MIYWTLLVFSFAFYIFAQFGKTSSPSFEVHSIDENNKNKKYFIFVTLFMIILVGFRDFSVGIDTYGYYKTYIRYANIDFNYIFRDHVKEKGYIFIQILFNKLGIGFLGFNILYAVFNFCIISLLIYRYSKMPWLSYFLYICFSFYTLSFTMVRQTLAMSIVILAVMQDKKDGIWSFLKFVLFIYIAHMFHSSAIITLPLWFVRRIKFNKRLAIVIFIIAFFTFVFKSKMANFVINYATEISDKYESYNVKTGNAGVLLYMMMIVSVMFGYMLKSFLFEKDNVFFFYCLCIMIILFPAVQGGNAIMRIYYYFYIFMIVYIPNMLESIRKEEHFYVKLFILMLYIGVGIYCFRSGLLHNTYGVMPYKLFSGTN